jgi:ABC-type Mn2+/Zn2+ transport system permease subunit
VSAAVAVVAGVSGLYLSYYAGTAAGASIAAMLVAAYLLAGLGSGVVARA